MLRNAPSLYGILVYILRTGRQKFKVLLPFPEDYRLLDRLCQDLRKLVDENPRISKQITSVLKEFYPKAVELFSLDSNIGIAFLNIFPDPQALRPCKTKPFEAFLRNIITTNPTRSKRYGNWFKLRHLTQIH